MTSVACIYSPVKSLYHPDSGQTQTTPAIPQPPETMRGLPAPNILELVDLGFSIIPIERGTKHTPAGLGWKRYQDERATREQVKQWQQDFSGCSWAAVCGAVSGNVIAVDIDSPAAFGWCQRQGGLNDHWPVWYETGRGWQYLFRLPAELADYATGVIVPHPCVEIRMGRHISVLPPSIHKTGKAYTWKRFGEIPYAPQWILDHLTGKPTQEAVTSTTSQQRAAHSITQTHHGRQAHDITGRNPRILTSAGYQWLWRTTFGPGHHHHPFFSVAILLRGARLSEDKATHKLDQWRRKCTRPIYSEREATAVIKKVYRTAYGVTFEGLRSAYDIHGERMPEGAALDLVRMFPSMRAPGKRQNIPMIATVTRPAHSITQTHHGRQPRDITGRNPRILKSAGYRRAWSTTFPEGSRNSACFSVTDLIRGAGLNQDEAQHKIDEWRVKCTRPVYSEREAAAVVKSVYHIGYGVTLEGLRKAYDIHGERMPEGEALDLVRMFPSMRAPGKRQNIPMIATVARILISLYKNHVMQPTAITHAELAKMTRCTERQVAEVAGFLSKIGVRTTRRQGRSLRSIYSLKALTASPDILIHMFVRWGGYQADSKLVVWRWWKRLHSMLAQLFRYLADVFESLSTTLAGEPVDPIGRLEFASTSTRGPPN